MKIVVGGIHTECSTYSPLLQTAKDFRVVEGEALLKQVGLNRKQFGDADFCPLFHARSIPGGPVSQDCYVNFKRRFLRELENSLPVDGVLLIMHGAMHVPGMEDVEGDWISAVRDLVGDAPPIAVSYDLHGNVTQRIVDQIDIFCAYRTAPHIDVKETHLRAASLLVDQLQGGRRESVAWAPIPVLLPGERTSTEDEPAKSLYASLPKYDRRQDVSDANLMVGYVWADVGRATAAAVVTASAPAAAKLAAEEIATAYWAQRSAFEFGVPTKSLEKCLEAAEHAKTFPFILADSGDNPTGGGVGDRSDVLAAWLKRGLKDGVFAGIADPKAIDNAWDTPVGATIELSIGGALGSSCQCVTAEGTIERKIGSKQAGDRKLLARISNNLLILTEQRCPFHNLADFRSLGIEPSSCKYLIVKSGYLSPELASLANPPCMALTDGAVNQEILALTNLQRHSPSYPFQQDFAWKAEARLSRRVNIKDKFQEVKNQSLSDER
jgi:microcystin degradation protein MlrC